MLPGGSIAATGEEDDDDESPGHAAKKAKHNVAERRRTSRLNALFEELSTMLASRPDLFCEYDPGARRPRTIRPSTEGLDTD